MKIKNYLLIACLMVVFTAFKASAQGVSPEIKAKYENWSAVPGDKTNSISVSLKLDGAMDGSTMCKLNLKNSSTSCKHVKLTMSYSLNNGNVVSKTVDAYVQPNSKVAPYYSSPKGMDYFYFNAAKITEPITATVVEVSDACK
jgi:hypothetical protein